jgi:hypothetical protein
LRYCWGGGAEEITFLFFWFNVQTLKHFQATLSNADHTKQIKNATNTHSTDKNKIIAVSMLSDIVVCSVYVRT